jgi:hypothetical protein
VGGAAPFYLQEQGWHENEFARCAVAPVLLLDDDLRSEFYQALGVSRWADGKLLNGLKTRLTKLVIENLVGDVSQAIRDEHLHIFKTTPLGTLAQTLYAAGASPNGLEAKRWRNFRVILAHDDRLVGVSRMLQLLDDLSFASNQVQVVWGSHFLFSVSNRLHRIHLRNREIVLGEILHLHELCRERQSF